MASDPASSFLSDHPMLYAVFTTAASVLTFIVGRKGVKKRGEKDADTENERNVMGVSTNDTAADMARLISANSVRLARVETEVADMRANMLAVRQSLEKAAEILESIRQNDGRNDERIKSLTARLERLERQYDDLASRINNRFRSSPGGSTNSSSSSADRRSSG